jgi:hypothetical protein
MWRRLLLLIVSTAAIAPTVRIAPAAEKVAKNEPVVAEALAPGATTIYRYGFEPEPNEEPDEWPPGWTRRRGTGFPGYLPITVQSESRSEGDFALRLQLDGGAAAVYSPPLPCSILADYVFQGAIRVEPLTHDRAFFSLSFIDDQRRVVAQFTSEQRQQTDGWRKLRIGPVRAPNEQAKYVVIGLHLEPIADRNDIKGRAEFDDLWLAQVPRVSIELNDRLRLFAPGQDVTIRCRTMGDGARPTSSALHVVDAFGQPVDAPLTKLEDDTPVPIKSEKKPLLGPVAPVTIIGPSWKTRLKQPGFYRLRVELTYADQQVQRGETTIAVLAQGGLPLRGEFGWSMTHGGNDLPPDDLVRLLRESCVSWVKLPVWVGEDRAQVESLVALSKDLRGVGIDLVGVLNEPPAPVQKLLHVEPGAPMARVLRSPLDSWVSSLDLLLTRLSWQVRAWQVGNDRDLSLPSVEDLPQRVAALKKHLDAVGDDVTMGVAWPWKVADPAPVALPQSTEQPQLPWRFAVVSDATLGSPEELSAALIEAKKSNVPRWVSLEPTARDGGDIAARISDLVERISVAKQHGVAGIFLNTPIRPRGGVYTPDGSPGELLLPWRTTARALAGAIYLGELTMPNGSRNRVFVRDGQVIIAFAGRDPARETLYLGRNVQQIDVWGNSTTPAIDGKRQIIETGELPIFVLGADEAVIRFRLGLQLAHSKLPSQFGVRHKTGVQITNTFSTPINGVMRIDAPDGWRVSPDRHELRLNPGQTVSVPFDWHIPLNGTTGKQDVQFDFDVTSDRRYEFSAFAPVEIGQGDLQMILQSRLSPEGDLIVDQTVRNESDTPLALKCHLYVPGQRRHRAQVFAPAHGESQFTYTIPDGQALIGELMWVRAEEISGDRVLSQKFVAKE